MLRSEELSAVLATYRRDLVTGVVRSIVDEYRTKAVAGGPVPNQAEVAALARERIERDWRVVPRRILNATGVVLHTNLARAPLSAAAREAMWLASDYCDLEYDLVEGARGDRQTRIARQLTDLCSAESAFVTVSASAAMLLALTVLAKRREVVVSRGHLVEIGGGFRVPVILQQSGAKLVEVGTTNRTRLDDYRAAVTPRTAVILNVHASNFRQVGFIQAVPLGELAGLAREFDLPLIDDNGSGAFLDTETYGLAHEPTVQESLAAGSDLVVFSGDKLFGGPQAGVIVGRRALIDRLRTHPLARAVRPDKLTLAALSATVHSYLAGSAEHTVPVWRMIAQSGAQLETRARRMQQDCELGGIRCELSAGESTVGGGSLPGEVLPTTLLVLPRTITARALRLLEMPIVARTQAGRTLVDLRTVPQEDEPMLLQGLLAAAETDR